MKTSKTKIISLIALYSLITACNSGNSNSTSSQSNITKKSPTTKVTPNINSKITSDNIFNLIKKGKLSQNMNLHGIVISNDNNYIYHASYGTLVKQEIKDDGTLDKQEISIYNNRDYDEVVGVAISEDGNYITLIADDNYILMLKKSSNDEFYISFDDKIKATPTGIVISPDGKNAYISSTYDSIFSSTEGYIYWYTINDDGSMSYQNKMDRGSAQTSIAISPDNRFLYSTTDTGFINRYSINSKDGSFEYVDDYNELQNEELTSIAISPDNQYAFVGSNGSKNITVYTIHEDGSLNFYRQFPNDERITALTVSPNNKYLYVSDWDNYIHTYSITDNHCNDTPAPNVNWYGCNKSFQNLSNYDLSHANLSYANLHGANLTNTNLSQANLYRANLNNAILDNTNFSGSKIINTSFNTANFKNNNFNDTIIDNSFFNEANLQNVSFKNAKLKHNNFILADLENANLDNLSLVDTNFSQANLINTSFIKTNLAKSNFTLAKLISTDFTSADLSKSNGLDLITTEDIGKAFTTKLIKANLRDAHIVDDKINFCGENKTYLSLDEADLDGLTLGNNKKCSDNSIGCCKMK